MLPQIHLPTMKHLLHTLLLGLLTVVMVIDCPAASHRPASQPNIIVIFSDDQGQHDVGCYGSEFPTPNIDKIAQNGARLTDFYVAAPVCTPSRFGLLTGQLPNRSKDKLLGALMFLEGPDKHRGIRPQETTIASVLREAGYRTGLIGKWHLGHGEPGFLPHHHGFDYAFGSTGGCNDYFTTHYGIQPDWYRNGQRITPPGYVTDILTDEAVHFINQPAKQPFFLYLTYTAPHFAKGWDPINNVTTNTMQSKVQHLKRFLDIKDPLRREFAGMVAAMDDGIGRVMQALRVSGQEENTLVIFACDNGGDPKYGGNNEPFRGVKNTVYEGGVRVPCVMQWPGHIAPGSVVHQPLTTLDFFPTFCDLAGVSIKGRKLDGTNFLPAVMNGQTFSRDLFWQMLTGDALRSGDWKYVRIGKETMLFNLATDPYEQKNLAAQEGKKLAELQAIHAKIASDFGPRIETGRE